MSEDIIIPMVSGYVRGACSEHLKGGESACVLLVADDSGEVFHGLVANRDRVNSHFAVVVSQKAKWIKPVQGSATPFWITTENAADVLLLSGSEPE